MIDIAKLVDEYLKSNDFEDFNAQIRYYENVGERKSAIEHACLGIYYKIDNEGEEQVYISSHYKHRIKTLHELLNVRNKLLKCDQLKIENLQKYDDFESFYSVMYQQIYDMYGIGSLLLYDIALRISAYFQKLIGKDLRPKHVYAQSGAIYGLKGLNKLAKETKRLVLKNDSEVVNYKWFIDNFPAMEKLEEPMHIENFLCVFDKELNGKTRK